MNTLPSSLSRTAMPGVPRALADQAGPALHAVLARSALTAVPYTEWSPRMAQQARDTQARSMRRQLAAWRARAVRRAERSRAWTVRGLMAVSSASLMACASPPAPTATAPRWNVAPLLRQEGRDDAALARGYLALAQTYEHEGRLALAAETFGKAARAAERDAAIQTLAGAGLARSGDASQAVEVLRHAVALQPGRAGALNNLGHALMLAGREREAAEVLRLALAADPAHARARANLLALDHRPELLLALAPPAIGQPAASQPAAVAAVTSEATAQLTASSVAPVAATPPRNGMLVVEPVPQAEPLTVVATPTQEPLEVVPVQAAALTAQAQPVAVPVVQADAGALPELGTLLAAARTDVRPASVAVAVAPVSTAASVRQPEPAAREMSAASTPTETPEPVAMDVPVASTEQPPQQSPADARDLAGAWALADALAMLDERPATDALPVVATLPVPTVVLQANAPAGVQVAASTVPAPMAAALPLPIRLAVANGVGIDGAAKRIAQMLQRDGLVLATVPRLQNLLPYQTRQTVVQYRTGQRAAALQAAQVLPAGVALVEVPAQASPADVRIVLGRDQHAWLAGCAKAPGCVVPATADYALAMVR